MKVYHIGIWDIVFPILEQYPEYFPKGSIKLSGYLWAQQNIQSRAFSFAKIYKKFMPTLAEFINHDGVRSYIINEEDFKINKLYDIGS